MTQPTESKFPQQFDDDNSLYLVKDGLQVTLAIDYSPGDISVVAEENIDNWPMSGIITLVDQDSSPLEKAVSFYYGRRTNREFLDIELISDSMNSYKPKKLTKITMQVVADHREALKNAIIEIEKFLGTKYEIAKTPSTGSVFGRLNYLKSILFKPKAWFEATRVVGTAPLTTKFTFTGTGINGPIGEVNFIWKFNDEEMLTVEPYVEKVFLNPGKYTISLKVKNYYGEDTVTFIDMINVKGQAPDQAIVKFLPLHTQMYFDDIIPKIRTPINQPINIEVPQKQTENKKTFAGEILSSVTNKAIDPIDTYTWNLNDDLPHVNSSKTKALYNIGGLYDMILRTDTEGGTYRITTYKNCIDVVEPTNLWIWSIDNSKINSYEFGLISEVIKTSNNSQEIYIQDSFIEDSNKRKKFEFWRNNCVAHVDNIKSGNGGEVEIFWASGRRKDEDIANEDIKILKYNGFTDIYTVKRSIGRPWNWASIIINNNVYFILGSENTGHLPTLSMTNQTKTTYDLSNSHSYTNYLEYNNYKNGAHELMQNPGVFDEKLNTKHGHYSAYRTVSKGQVGYILRNSDMGEYFCFKNFYKTEGTISSPFQNIVKLPDAPGENNREGSLVALNNGIYYFNNFGNTYCFNDSTTSWELVFDHNRLGKDEFDSLLASSDGESKAYINVTNGSFFKFNELDMSYSTLNHKPLNKQWLMTVF